MYFWGNMPSRQLVHRIYKSRDFKKKAFLPFRVEDLYKVQNFLVRSREIIEETSTSIFFEYSGAKQ